MIRIIKGTYGYLNENGTVKPKTEKDGPFSLTDEQEKRLVDLGVAEYVEDDGGAPIGFDEQPPEEELDEMTAKELRELGKEYGLTFKVGMKKAEMVEAIEAAQSDAAADTSEDEDDGEPLPTFDPAEAVE